MGSKLLSAVGIWIYNIAAAIIVYDITRSAFLVGLVSVFQFIPQVLMAPWTGALADKYSRRGLVVGGRFAVAVGAGGLGLFIAMVGFESLLSPWPVMLAAFVVGVGFAVSLPAMLALVPLLVRPNELVAAIALDSLPFTIARAAGPALGVLLLTAAGPSIAFGAAAATSALFALIVGIVPLRTIARLDEVDRSVRRGLSYARQDRVLKMALLGVIAVGIGVDPVITLTPPLADVLNGGARLVGNLASMFGIGAALSIFIVGAMRQRLGLERLASWGLGIFSLGIASLTVSSSPSHGMAAMAIAGVGMMLSITALTARLQLRVPEEFRGRIMALWAVAFVGSRPAAAAVNGAIADWVSVHVALLLTAAVLAFAAAAIRAER